ncbi:MAG: hypothetical protein NC079_02820 [Clostridium sp.]|nr:hypothetical protein [Acetatifactor muris]MCM1528323.1 hypothetical protein [Bacteroides sp.]MCM1562523.1 hypothetical protein [Clostridium sp.]
MESGLQNGMQNQIQSGTGSETENAPTLDMERRLLKELRFTRIICMISSALTLFLLAGGAVLFSRVQKLEELCRPVVEQLAGVDVESFNATLNQVSQTLEDVDWERVSNVLGEFDVESFNAAMEGLNTEELSEGLENLNDAVEKIREISGKFPFNMF